MPNQGRSKLLKLGGALHLRAMQTNEIQGRFCTFVPKNRGCTCTPGTPSSYGPELEVSRKSLPPSHLNWSARIRVRLGSNHSQSLMAGIFVVLWPTDPEFSAFKGLNPFKIVWKFQKASSILKVDFVLSNRPHFTS